MSEVMLLGVRLLCKNSVTQFVFVSKFFKLRNNLPKNHLDIPLSIIVYKNGEEIFENFLKN